MTRRSPFRRFGAYDVQLHQGAASVIASAASDSPFAPSGELPHEFQWFQATADGNLWWLDVRDLQHRPVAGFSVSVMPTRALPGHRLLRVERLRFAPDPGPAEAAVLYLVDLARRDRRTLSLTVETFFADKAEGSEAQAVLERAGFRPARKIRMYTHTPRIDLTRELEEVLSGIHATARRNIRAVSKHPVEVRLVEDIALASRLSEVLSETFDRTAGEVEQERWPALIEYGRAHPERVRLVSLVRTDREGPEALVAFALGLNHGDHVEYATGGSTRPRDLKMPLGYALVWDLMVWARSLGASWFDFGGIAANASDDGSRKGIHDFKRAFGSNVVEVSQSWALEVRPAREAWVRLVSRLTEQLRRLRRLMARPNPPKQKAPD